MQPTLYWIATPAAGRLATMARPRGGDWLAGELAALRAVDVDTLVSLLTVEELSELELDAESDLAHIAGLRFQSFPIPDYNVPRLDADTADCGYRRRVVSPTCPPKRTGAQQNEH